MLNNLLTRLRSASWPSWLFRSFIALLAIAACYFAYRTYCMGMPKPSATPMQIAPQASVLAGVEKQPLPQPVIVRAYNKAQAVKKLQLPQGVADDPDSQVISSAELGPSKGGYVTATVLDTRTGEAVTRVTEKPRALFELGGQTELGLRYGLTSRGGQQAAVYARQDLLRISAVTVAGYGEVNAGSASQSEAKAMLDIRMAW